MSQKHSVVASEAGSVLIISLFMLIVLTLVGVSVIKISTANLQMVNNMQGRHQALAAATDVINQVLSSSFINDTALDAGLTAVSTASYTYSPQGSGGTSYSVSVSKPCLKSIVQVRNSEIGALVATNAGFQSCLGTGVWSNCYRSVWQLTASVKSGFLGAKTDVTQGSEIILSQVAGIAAGSVTKAYYCTS